MLPTFLVGLKDFSSNQNKNSSELVSFSHVVGQCLGSHCIAK